MKALLIMLILAIPNTLWAQNDHILLEEQSKYSCTSNDADKLLDMENVPLSRERISDMEIDAEGEASFFYSVVNQLICSDSDFGRLDTPLATDSQLPSEEKAGILAKGQQDEVLTQIYLDFTSLWYTDPRVHSAYPHGIGTLSEFVSNGPSHFRATYRTGGKPEYCFPTPRAKMESQAKLANIPQEESEQISSNISSAKAYQAQKASYYKVSAPECRDLLFQKILDKMQINSDSIRSVKSYFHDSVIVRQVLPISAH